MDKILVNNKMILTTDFVKLANQTMLYFALSDDKGNPLSSDFIDEPEIVALYNLICLLYGNGISVECLLVNGTGLYKDIDKLKGNANDLHGRTE